MTIQRLAISFLSLAVLALLSLPANAAKPLPLPAGEPINFFDAISSGDIEAKFIPENAAKGTVVVTNKSAKPLTIQLPKSFAGIPIQAQFNVGNNNGPQTANSSTGGGNQQLGGTINNNNRNNQAGPGLFSIAPEQVTKLKVTSVCLEFGKKTPHTRIPYQLAPLSAAATDPRLAGLLNHLRTGQIDQPTAQAAAWHLANHITWQDLAQKTRRHLATPSEPLFTQAQITRAKQTVAQLSSSPTGTGTPLSATEN